MLTKRSLNTFGYFLYDSARLSSFFFQAEDGIRAIGVTGVQTCALPIWRSTQHSLKKLPARKFFGTRDQVRTAEMLLPMPWWKEPQATSSFGPTPLSRRTGAAGFVACPKRSNALLTWLKKSLFRMLVTGTSSLVERSARV